MTAWDILRSNSTASDGSTAWEHLNNQNTGTGTGTGTIVHEQFEARLEEDIQVSLQHAEEVSVVLEGVTVVIEETDVTATDEQIQVNI